MKNAFSCGAYGPSTCLPSCSVCSFAPFCWVALFSLLICGRDLRFLKKSSGKRLLLPHTCHCVCSDLTGQDSARSPCCCRATQISSPAGKRMGRCGPSVSLTSAAFSSTLCLVWGLGEGKQRGCFAEKKEGALGFGPVTQTSSPKDSCQGPGPQIPVPAWGKPRRSQGTARKARTPSFL